MLAATRLNSLFPLCGWGDDFLSTRWGFALDQTAATELALRDYEPNQNQQRALIIAPIKGELANGPQMVVWKTITEQKMYERRKGHTVFIKHAEFYPHDLLRTRIELFFIPECREKAMACSKTSLWTFTARHYFILSLTLGHEISCPEQMFTADYPDT